MKSKASIKGHPVHPILVTFPIAFFTATLFFDIAGLHNSVNSAIGSRLELLGIIGAMAAAIPGIVDYLYTVPPQSSAKKRGATHGILNLSMTALFTFSFIYRQHDDASMYIIIALEACGFILMCIAGWMGGTLVFRNMIGIYNRYADAGKWNEIYLNTDDKQIEVALINELKINQLN